MIAVRGLTHRQGAFELRDISFSVPAGKYAVLMGSTGCGKTTLLEVIAGLRQAERGRVELGEVDVSNLPPAGRGIGYVPQDGALFSTMTVAEHLAFALRVRHRPQAEIEQRIEELASWLGLTHLLMRRPAGLSGGEVQRVALGRALSFRPKYLLLDEPLSSLDEKTRDAMIAWLLELKDRREATVLHVTHNRGEAERLADVRLRMVDGQVLGADHESG